MDDLHLETLPIRHLEWLFDPPGVPIPQRIVGKTQTTSALVRGAAGTGKTTLALGLAIGIADALGGNVYYLSTEIAPVDVRFKLKPIGLEPGTALGLSERKDGARILTEHLRLVSDANVEEKGVRTRAALERVQTVIFDGLMPDARVVVIDAFSLVGDGGDATALRVHLAETIQAFDGCGVSVVLVEEAPVMGADWASFVVDLVFELGWGEDPDTRARIRQLSCPKSRFATASCGPHDYGMEAGRLAVWPDITTVSYPALMLRYNPNHRTSCVTGPRQTAITGLVGTAIGPTFGSAINILLHTPWLQIIKASMAGVPSVGGRTTSAHEGPAALAWLILQEAVDKGADVLILGEIGFALGRTRYFVPLFGALQVISELGVIVVVHDADHAIQRVPAAFSYVEGEREMARQLDAVVLSAHFELPGSDLREEARALSGLLHQEVTPSPRDLRRWALWHAEALRQPRALDWYLAQGDPSPDEEPYLRHALARNGRMNEAIARIPTDDPTRHRLLVAELHLNLFTPEGLAVAEPAYTDLLADANVSAADKKLMQEQLTEVREALAT